MQAIQYCITALSPLLLSSNTGDPNMVATFDYIPGTHLRGLFANEYIRKKGIISEAHKDETFYRWFLKGEIKITNGYIVQKKEDKFLKLLPIPLSIQREKGKNEIAYDLLLQNEEFDIKKTSISGYGRFTGGNIFIKNVKKSLNFHHSRDRKRGVSKEGQIFNYESIDKGQVFAGFLIGKSNDLKEFLSIIQDGVYYLGRSRNNQYGKIKLEFINKEPFEFSSERDTEDEKQTLILTLLSDAIIINEFGYSTTDISQMETELGCKIKRAFIKQKEQEGFISAWKLKTPSEVSFKAGSCFLLENANLEKLKELQRTGIGIRTHEGFGRFVIDWQSEEIQEKIYIKESKDEVIAKKPQSPASQSINEIIKTAIKEYIKKEIQNQAIKDAKSFTEIPSKSLLARLEASVKTEVFKTTIKKLKQTAKNQLERCQNKNITLYDFITTEIEKKVQNCISNLIQIEKVCNEVSYIPISDSKFMRELQELYLITFLSTMRKSKKVK